MKRTVIGLTIIGISVALLSMFSSSADAGRRHRPYCEKIGGYCYKIQFGDVDQEAHVYVNGQRRRVVKGNFLLDLDPLLQPGPNTVDIRLGNGDCFRSSLSVTVVAGSERRMFFPLRADQSQRRH